MLAAELITERIPPLKTSDTGSKALAWMEEFKVSCLPIVNNIDYLGVISEDDILNMNQSEEPIGNHQLSLLRPFVNENQHIYEVIKMLSDLKLSVLPVLHNGNEYRGLITSSELVQKFASMAALNDPGSIVTLEINQYNYSLSEIIHIVEQHDGLVLSSYITSVPNSTRMELTLKINQPDISRILASFFRYGYTVKATYQFNEYEEDLRKRYESLINYLNV